MIVPKEIAEQVEVGMVPMELFEMIHNFSLYLLIDDIHDVGRGQYYNRIDHFYHGRKSPNHPSPFHHYQIAIAGLLLSQVGSLFVKGMELFDDYKKIESGDLSGLDDDIKDLVDENNTISLSEYKEEVENIPKHLEKTDTQSQLDPLKIPEITNLPGF